MVTLRRLYGAPLPHLLLMAGMFALVAYAGVRLLGGGSAVGIVVWFVGAAVLHDLLFVPAYSLLDCGLRLVLRRPACGRGAGAASTRVLNHVRVPAVVSGLLFLVYFPLILGPSPGYLSKSGLDGNPFGPRWLLVCACLFAVSALVGAVRYLRTPAVDRPR